MKWEIQYVYILIIPSFSYIKVKLNKLPERLIIKMIGNDSIFPVNLNRFVRNYYISGDQSTENNVD